MPTFTIDSKQLFNQSVTWIKEHDWELSWSTLTDSYDKVMIDGNGPFPLKRRHIFFLLYDHSGEAIAFRQELK